MTLANQYDYRERTQLPLQWERSESSSLSLIVEQHARSLRGETAFITPNSKSKSDVGGYGLLGFRDLVIEQNAWLNFLLNRGVERGDRVLVCLPHSAGLVSVCYALFRIGADVVLVEPSFNWRVGAATIRELDPKHMLGMPDSLSYSKWIAGESGEVNRIEILDPNRLVGSAIRSFQMRRVDWGRESATLTIVSVAGNQCVSASYEQQQLCLLASYYREWFDLQEGDRGVPGSLLEAILFPAAGLASVVVGDELSDGSPYAVEQVMEAVERFEVGIVSGDLSFWRGVSRFVERGKLLLPHSLKGLVRGPRARDCKLDTIERTLPQVELSRVFGTACNPFITMREEVDLPAKAEEFRGIYLGKPLPGIQVSLLPCEELRWADEPQAATPVGEIATAKREYAPLYDLDSWEGTGELGFFDREGGLWHCGSRSDVIGTTFGGFSPVRCETVFNRHPKVQRTALIALRKNGKTRPGLVVETKLGELPKRGVEESKFKAELLQLAMDIEETSIIVDIFFSDRLPLDEGGLDGIDRKRLSVEYSKRLRY